MTRKRYCSTDDQSCQRDSSGRRREKRPGQQTEIYHPLSRPRTQIKRRHRAAPSDPLVSLCSGRRTGSNDRSGGLGLLVTAGKGRRFEWKLDDSNKIGRNEGNIGKLNDVAIYKSQTSRPFPSRCSLVHEPCRANPWQGEAFHANQSTTWRLLLLILILFTYPGKCHSSNKVYQKHVI